MPVPFKKYVVREAVLIAAFNASINAAYTLYLWRSLDPVRLTGEGGILLDLALTPIVIAVLSTVIGTGLVRRKLADGRISVERGTAAHRLLHRLPQGILARAAAAAALTGLLFAMPLWLLLPLGGNGILTPLDASATKVAITIVLSLVIVPVVTLAALADAQRAFAVRGIA